MSKEVVFTGPIPQCPHCEKPTIRTQGYSSTTCLYSVPVYNEKGENISTDMNTTTTDYHCQECGNSFTVIRKAGKVSYAENFTRAVNGPDEQNSIH